MGCGDGTLLRTIYTYVKDKTARGKVLDSYPLRMVGVDFNQASLHETDAMLSEAGVPHDTMFGDIGDPLPMQAELERRFGVAKDACLHVRSFLDHDRPFIAPVEPIPRALVTAINSFSDGCYTQVEGNIVPPSEVFASLIEHMDRWRQCLGKWGLLLLEVSLLAVPTTTKHLRDATSLHFDACQAHSGQMLMPASLFALGAAAAGLFPAPAMLLYPKEAAYTRILLQQLLPHSTRIRLATTDDLDALLQLENHWEHEYLMASRETLTCRLDQHPSGQAFSHLCPYDAILPITPAATLK